MVREGDLEDMGLCCYFISRGDEILLRWRLRMREHVNSVSRIGQVLILIDEGERERA